MTIVYNFSTYKLYYLCTLVLWINLNAMYIYINILYIIA